MYGSGPENFDHLSNDFNIPGTIPFLKFFIEGDGLFDTWSNPGYLTVTFSGKKTSWAMCPMLDAQMTSGLGYVELDKFEPPLELEIGFVAPDDSIPWNLWHSIGIIDERGGSHYWSPTIQNIPGKGRFYVNSVSQDPYELAENPDVDIRFAEEVPQSVMTHEPLRMLIQFMDKSHIRVGLRGPDTEPWHFSEPFDTSEQWGEIEKFSLPCPGSTVGLKGAKVGNYPRHLRFLIDYIRYGYGTSD